MSLDIYKKYLAFYIYCFLLIFYYIFKKYNKKIIKYLYIITEITFWSERVIQSAVHQHAAFFWTTMQECILLFKDE